MNKLLIMGLATLAVVVASAFGAPNPRDSAAKKNGLPVLLGDSFDISGEDLNNMDANNVLAYNPADPKPVRVELQPAGGSRDAKLKSSSYTDLEREASGANKRGPSVANVMVAEGADAERSGSPNVDKIKDIAMNSREVRLVGPNQKEVEMRDDLPTKVVVALENLQKEAQEVLGQVNEKLDKGWTEIKRSEVWGQVNEKLDKGWTDLKGMLESVVKPASKSG